MKQPVLSLIRAVIALLVFYSTAALAQQDAGAFIAQQQDRVANFSRTTSQLQSRVALGADDDDALIEIRGRLEEAARDVSSTIAIYRSRLAAISARLDAIGPPHGDNEPPEPEALTLERRTLTQERSEINVLLGETENLVPRITQLIAEVAQLRRGLFSNNLWRRHDITSAFSPKVLNDFALENRKLFGALWSWLGFILTYKIRAVLLATALALGAAGILFIGGRRLIGKMLYADPMRENPSYLSRLSVAFWSTLLPSASLGVFLAATYFFYDYYAVLRPDIAQIAATSFSVVAIIYFVYSLSSSVFSPRLPNWRLVPVESGAARILFVLTMLMALVTGGDFVAGRINHVMGSPLSLTVAKSLVATLIVGVLTIAIGLVKPYTGEDGRPRPWHPLVRGMLYLIGGGTILAALLGYIGLARFISQQVVVTGAILVTMYLGYQSASAISEVGGFKRTKLGRKLDERFHFDDATEDQIGLMFSIAINLIVLSVGIPLILLQWGFQWSDIEAWLYSVATELRIGSITISLTGIVTGIGIFLLGYFGTRIFQHWLDGKVMARGRMDAGLRNSIGTAVGYAGIALAALVGVSVAGIDLSNLALVAGALSLGIGFGLQNIVSNFVSGLILLAERPFKVGDWIVASGTEGNVRKISVRATEVETFQRQTVIVPNSLLINASVGNWTHRNRLGRVDIPVTAAAANDARRVHALLKDIVREQPLALKNPEPVVAFNGMSGGLLNFEVRVVLPDITNQLGFTNELRFSIVERFAKEGIV